MTAHEDAVATGGRPPAVLAGPRPATLAKGALVVLGLYLLVPMATATHPEGFTALIQNAAAAANAGMVERSNILYPLHGEYFYLTRVGVIYLLQLFMWISGGAGDGNFRALTSLSYAGFVVATLVIARRRGGIGYWWGLAALLMAPGYVELGYYFNDNVVSTAFGLAGLALLPATVDPREHGGRSADRVLQAVLAGAALGYAVLCRPDAVLLLPFAALFAYLDERRFVPLAKVLALLGVGMLIAFVLSYALGGSSVLQSLENTRVFLQIHTFPRARIDYAVLLLYTMGIPLLLLLPIGVWREWRRTSQTPWLNRLAFVVVPVVMLLYFLPNAQEVRHFYPLVAPFIVILGARALQWLFAEAGATMRRMRLVAIGLVLALWLAPPLVYLKDGPRLPLGRAWSPLVWLQYQRDVEWNLASADRIVERADTLPRLTVLAAQYDSDHYFQRALWQHGYLPYPVEQIYPGCKGGVEVWQKPGHRVMHVRTENAHINQRPLSYTEAIQLQRGFACPAVLQDTPVMVTSLFFRTDSWLWMLDEKPEALWVKRGYGVRYLWLERLGLALGGPRRGWLAQGVLSYNRVVDLSPADVGRLRSVVDGDVRKYVDEMPPYLRTYEGIMGLFVARVAWPRDVDGRVRWRPVPPPVIPLPGPPPRGAEPE